MPAYGIPTARTSRSAFPGTGNGAQVDWVAAGDIYDAFTRPGLDVTFTDPRPLGTCEACPAHDLPLSAEAEVVFSPHGSPRVDRVAVCRGCAGAVINQTLRHPTPCRLWVEIPAVLAEAVA